MEAISPKKGWKPSSPCISRFLDSRRVINTNSNWYCFKSGSPWLPGRLSLKYAIAPQMASLSKICKNMQKIFTYAKYAIMTFICKMCSSMHSPLCWWRAMAEPKPGPWAAPAWARDPTLWLRGWGSRLYVWSSLSSGFLIPHDIICQHMISQFDIWYHMSNYDIILYIMYMIPSIITQV